jgi:hypothetical protein
VAPVSLAGLIAIVLAVAGVAAALMYLFRRLGGEKEFYFVEVERGTSIFAFVSTAFAVLLAFVVLEAYDSFNEARTGVESEAISVVELSRTADLLEEDDRRRFTGLLVCYGRAVVHDEWPAMRDGTEGGSPVVAHWGKGLRDVEAGFKVRTPIQEAAFLQLLEEQDERTEARRARLHEAVRQLPAPVWFILGLGGVLTIGWVLLLTDRREHVVVQASVMAAVAALVTTGLLLVWFLDHPYSGGAESGGISPHEMEESLEMIEDETREHGPLSPPCDEAGDPLPGPAARRQA